MATPRRASRYESLNEHILRERLVERIHARDESAFDRLFRLAYPPLVDFVCKYVRSSQDAEELVTDLFVRIWDMEERWIVRGPVMTYLFGAARNRALDRRARDASEAERHLDLEAYYTAQDHPNAIDPLGEIDLADLSSRARTVLESLSPRGREIFILIRRDGMSIREAAAVLGIAPSTVQTYLGRAVLAFQRALLRDD